MTHQKTIPKYRDTGEEISYETQTRNTHTTLVSPPFRCCFPFFRSLCVCDSDFCVPSVALLSHFFQHCKSVAKTRTRRRRKGMYRDTGVLIVILISLSVVVIWFVGCFLWNCRCCECCIDCRQKTCRNPVAARPSVVSVMTQRNSVPRVARY